MSIDSQTLMQLLPAIYRIRDAEHAERNGTVSGPLQDLMTIIAGQLAVIEENIEQSYDDLFIETCSSWLTGYIGDLIGYQSLYGDIPEVASPRAEVAHTIALRRRKGTAVVLEQLARDVTSWDARAVEFFKQLGWTQYANHTRGAVHYCPDFRDREKLERIGSAFNTVQHSVDIRRVESARGRFNIPNIGIFLWRLDAYRHSAIPALRLAARRYLASPLGHAINLYSFPRPADPFIHELSSPVHVPEPLSRRQLHDHKSDYYGLRETAADDVDNSDPSILLRVNGVEITREQLIVCNLADDGADWAHQPPDGKYAIDPVLGRIALPSDAGDPADVRVSYFHGFSANLGGGEYERERSFSIQQDGSPACVPDDHATIQDAISALGGNGVVEITDNGRYEESLSVTVGEGDHIELRAADKRNPHLALTGPMTVSGAKDSRFSINGLLVSGDMLTVDDDGTNELRQLDIAHCTLVPGSTLDANGDAVTPGAVSLTIALPAVNVSIDHSITGAIRAVVDTSINADNCIVDATDTANVAYADVDHDSAGAGLSATACTFIGKIHAREFGTVSNCILLASLTDGDSWNAAIWTERKQTGCVRFSFLPFDSIVPRRYRCQPDSEESAQRLAPRFTSLDYGQPAYAQLSPYTDDAIWRGANDESEMGAFHDLYAPQRERNLRIRLNEYLRVGLEAGIFYES